MNVSKTTLCVAVLMVFALAACNKGKEKASPSQVLARVNDTEITVHELNYVLQHQQVKDNAAKQHALDELIDQEVMVQRATALKLDRDPNVLQAIEFSKRQILAQAAATREIGTPAEPKQTAIDEFYQKNALLFADRKVYTFDVFSVPGDAVTPAVTKALDGSHSVAETKSILNKADIKFSDSEQKRAAEQLPMSDLQKVATMKDGDMLLVKQADGMVVLQLINATPAPVSIQDAGPAIKAFLQNEDKQKTAQAHYKALKDAAKIEYLQKFDKDATSTTTGPTSPQPAKPDDADNQLSKGVKGLN